MTDTFTDEVATAIRVELARKRISASNVAEQLGLSQAAVSRRLSGEVVIDVNELAAIARIVGVEPRDLLPKSPLVETAS